MPFSFFGKKPPPAPPPRPAKRPRAPDPQAARASSGANAPEVPLPTLEFTDSAKPRPDHTQPKHDVAIGNGSQHVHPVVEEAAILYANGDDGRALEVLENAIQREDLGGSEELVWFLLFDLYQLGGKREPFDAKAVDYAVRFGKSPPTWNASENGDARAATGAIPMVTLGPGFDGAGGKQLDMFARMASKHASVRADLGKLKTVDEAGCAKLTGILQSARKGKREIVLQNAASLAGVLEKQVASGDREHPAAWLLLLEIYQQQGVQEKFEECAVNYAVTFEVSPPSWEPPRRPARAAHKPASAPAAPGVYALSGELAGASAAVAHRLDEFAATHDPVVIDLGGLRRMDFVCAGTFLNTLTGLRANGRSVVIRGANHLVFGLFGVLGIHQVAKLEPRKA